MSLFASPLLSSFAQMQANASTTNTAATPTNEVPSTETTPARQHSASNPESDANPKRKVQMVLTNTHKARIAKWMIEKAAQDGPKHIASKTVSQFPEFFRSSVKANLQRASRYWKQREAIVEGHSRAARTQKYSFVKHTKTGLKRHYCKTQGERGRRVTPWVAALYTDLYNEFNRMRKSGMKFNTQLLRRLALHLIQGNTSGVYNLNTVDPRNGTPIKDLVTPRWIQFFMAKYSVVSRYQCGKLMVSPAKQEQIEPEVAFHLGQLARDFQSNGLREEDVYNADETHFCMNMDNHKTLALVGDTNVRYADVVSGDDGITMMVLIAGGPNARLETPMLIFKNADKNYPIRGLPDDVPGVVYRTGPKAWMDKRVFLQWLREKRVFTRLPNGRKRILYIDNVNTHALNDEVHQALAESNTEIRFFPCNATHLVQPADSFVIQKLKTNWRKEWDEHKMGLLEKGLWSDGLRSSGKLTNPGKRYFLKLGAQSVRTVSAQRDSDGVSYARKAMIRCGMALNLNGQWEERQLFPELQRIVRKYRENFEGLSVGSN